MYALSKSFPLAVEFRLSISFWASDGMLSSAGGIGVTFSFPKLRTEADVPLVAAIAPSELSATFASSRRAKILASVQPPVLVELAAIAEVSVAIVLDTAVVSVALLSFLLHAAAATAATARVATFNRVVIIVRLLPGSRSEPL